MVQAADTSGITKNDSTEHSLIHELSLHMPLPISNLLISLEGRERPVDTQK